MKTIIVISTGRCGTKRLTEILKHYLADQNISVKHQSTISRLANVLGNMMYYIGSIEWLKTWIFSTIYKTDSGGLIVTDPLSSMCLPREIYNNGETLILHIYREESSFAVSMFNLTRRRLFSFIAHNFIPLWQIGLWPLENLINPRIKKHYELICRKKNEWFKSQFGHLKNYRSIDMEQLFTSGFIEKILFEHFHIQVKIEDEQLKIKSN